MPRELATIRSITDISPIEGADAIECLHIDGWTVVAKKNEFKIKDKCVYFEIDSWIPHVIAPFLSKGKEPRLYNEILGERLRTVRLRGQLSQGLALPLSNFENCFISEELPVGYPVSNLLNVTLYEPPIPACLSGNIKGNFPNFVVKTDQERIQNLPEYFEKYPDVEFEVTEKLDGSSCTVYNNEGISGVCSRNWDLTEDVNNSFWKVVRNYNFIDSISELAVQGELIGEGIQGNKYKLQGQDLRVFDIYDIANKRYLMSNERMNVLDKINMRKENYNKLIHVPILRSIYLRNFTMESLLSYADGFSGASKFNTHREGIVCKSKELINGQIISFKVISNKFLLKNE